ncbi:MAG: isochorismatase family protein, partial [Bacteroidota bacterium]
ANQTGHEIGEVIDFHRLPQVLWPIHCVQDTMGAAFAQDLYMDRVARIFPKGTDSDIDSYSGFFDNGHRKATGLGDYLKEKGVEAVGVLGLATDYCVKFTALDAVSLGFQTTLYKAASRGVNLQTGDVDRAIEDMRNNGVLIQEDVPSS